MKKLLIIAALFSPTLVLADLSLCKSVAGLSIGLNKNESVSSWQEALAIKNMLNTGSQTKMDRALDAVYKKSYQSYRSLSEEEATKLVIKDCMRALAK